MAKVVYQGEEWQSHPIKEASSSELKIINKHRHKANCPCHILAKFKGAGILGTDKYVCETCKENL